MTRFMSTARMFFEVAVLSRPRTVILCILAVTLLLAFQARHFALDAGPDTLVPEGDEELRYTRLIGARYGEQPLLALTYTPKAELFSPSTLAELKRLRDELDSVERISSVISILDVPLFKSPPLQLKDITGNLRTLTSPGVDLEAARVELSQSPLYQDLLLSADTGTTALLLNLRPDQRYRSLLDRRDELRLEGTGSRPAASKEDELGAVLKELEKHRDFIRRRQHNDIATIRSVMENYRQNAELFLGGAGMISDDIIRFIRNDLVVFGVGVGIFMALALAVMFRAVRWVCLPLVCCGISVIWMAGLLGSMDWEITVVSANFISLQLIITMSVAIHLIVRYRELICLGNQNHRQVILETVCSKLIPCIYAMLTTVVGFGSLLLCDILPVVMFGRMMVLGLIVSLVITFLLFPSMLSLMPPETRFAGGLQRPCVTRFFASLTGRYAVLMVILSAAVFIFSFIGTSKLEVENSFINYFKKNTEIHRGMKVIDRKLGGTIPLDVVFGFGKSNQADKPQPEADAGDGEVFDQFEELEGASNDPKYWFTREKIRRIKAVHSYLDGLPETGKVLSLASILEVAEGLKGGKPMDSLELALLYSQTPEKFKNLLIRPYVSVEHNQARFWLRVRDSDENLDRNRLLAKIRRDLNDHVRFGQAQVRLAGLLVMYNNMLQSLFGSQILTFGLTALALTGMFLLLFRSLTIALIAMIPNILAVGVVLGLMGWMNVPLDMMTITIAAISIGIAVDDTIHYIHRFKQEFQTDRMYVATMHRCHASIGRAMYYTSVIITIGFSILALSNFIPTVYFGLLAGLAMLTALVADLTLLPAVLILVKPFGNEATVISGKGC